MQQKNYDNEQTKKKIIKNSKIALNIIKNKSTENGFAIVAAEQT